MSKAAGVSPPTSIPDFTVEGVGTEYHVRGLNHGHKYIDEPSSEVKRAVRREVDRAARDGRAYFEEGTAYLLREHQRRSPRVEELDDMTWMAERLQSPVPLDRFDRFVLGYAAKALTEIAATRIVEHLPETSLDYVERLRTKGRSHRNPEYLEDLVKEVEEAPLPFDVSPEGDVEKVFETGRNVYIAAKTAYRAENEDLEEVHVFTGASRVPGVRSALQKTAGRAEKIYDKVLESEDGLPEL